MRCAACTEAAHIRTAHALRHARATRCGHTRVQSITGTAHVLDTQNSERLGVVTHYIPQIS
eukprot:6702566-Pyramimonas_sp.AAC.1